MISGTEVEGVYLGSLVSSSGGKDQDSLRCTGKASARCYCTEHRYWPCLTATSLYSCKIRLTATLCLNRCFRLSVYIRFCVYDETTGRFLNKRSSKSQNLKENHPLSAVGILPILDTLQNVGTWRSADGPAVVLHRISADLTQRRGRPSTPWFWMVKVEVDGKPLTKAWHMAFSRDSTCSGRFETEGLVGR